MSSNTLVTLPTKDAVVFQQDQPSDHSLSIEVHACSPKANESRQHRTAKVNKSRSSNSSERRRRQKSKRQDAVSFLSSISLTTAPNQFTNLRPPKAANGVKRGPSFDNGYNVDENNPANIINNETDDIKKDPGAHIKSQPQNIPSPSGNFGLFLPHELTEASPQFPRPLEQNNNLQFSPTTTAKHDGNWNDQFPSETDSLVFSFANNEDTLDTGLASAVAATSTTPGETETEAALIVYDRDNDNGNDKNSNSINNNMVNTGDTGVFSPSSSPKTTAAATTTTATIAATTPTVSATVNATSPVTFRSAPVVLALVSDSLDEKYFIAASPASVAELATWTGTGTGTPETAAVVGTLALTVGENDAFTAKKQSSNKSTESGDTLCDLIEEMHSNNEMKKDGVTMMPKKVDQKAQSTTVLIDRVELMEDIQEVPSSPSTNERKPSASSAICTSLSNPNQHNLSTTALNVPTADEDLQRSMSLPQTYSIAKHSLKPILRKQLRRPPIRRVLLLPEKDSFPMAAFSVLKYKRHSGTLQKQVSDQSVHIGASQSMKVLRKLSTTHHESQRNYSLKPKARSYKCFLFDSPKDYYEDILLDDPDFRVGKHKTVVRLPSYMVSVTQYAKPSDLKRNLNEQFKEKFPNIPITLTKIRSLKREIRKIALVEANMEIASLILAFAYFEQLIIKGFVHKGNRKLVVATCLILGIKFYDQNIASATLKQLFDSIDKYLHIQKKELIASEFYIFAELEFALLAPHDDVMTQFKYLMHTMPEDYNFPLFAINKT